jgi:hypothetical protein
LISKPLNGGLSGFVSGLSGLTLLQKKSTQQTNSSYYKMGSEQQAINLSNLSLEQLNMLKQQVEEVLLLYECMHSLSINRKHNT